MNWFVTGTDTGVGKTYVTALLTRSLRRAGFDTVAMKPICCGDRGDVEILRAAGGDELTPEEINPVWLEMPVAPFVAAEAENRKIEVAEIMRAFGKLRAARRSLLVEGAGGWLVPITRDYFVADLAAEMALPILVVVQNRLGALNHALLTVADIQHRGLECAGFVLNTLAEEQSLAASSNRATLETISEVPVLFEIGLNQPDLALGVA